MLILPKYSFYKPYDVSACLVDFGDCLPFNGFDEIVIPLLDTETSPDTPGSLTVTVKVNGGDPATVGTTISWKKIKEEPAGESCVLVVDSFTPTSAFFVWYFNHYYPSYGVWSEDPFNPGHYISTGDIHAFSPAIGNMTTTIHPVTTCYLDFAPPPIGPDLADVISWLNTNYPANATWFESGGHLYPGMGDISGVTFPGTQVISGHEYTIAMTCVASSYMTISGYSATVSDETDWLTHIAGGTWTFVTDHFTWSGDLTTFDVTSIPGMTCHKVCTDLFTDTFAGYMTLTSDLPTVNNGDCLTINIDGTDLQCMQKADTCFTSLIKYRCNENAFGFGYYSDDGMGGNALASYYNQVRIPFFLQNPQTKTKKDVYRKSNGDYVKLSAWMELQHEAITDYIPKQWHLNLSVALEHDEFWIYNDLTSSWVQYSFKDGDYEVEWKNEPGINLNNAPAKFKLNEMPFDNVNTNCI